VAHTQDDPTPQIDAFEARLTKAADAQIALDKAAIAVMELQKATARGRAEVSPTSAKDAGELYGWHDPTEAEAPKDRGARLRAKVRDLLRELEEADSREAQKAAAIRLLPALGDLAKVAGGWNAPFSKAVGSDRWATQADVAKAIGSQSPVSDRDLGGVDTKGSFEFPAAPGAKLVPSGGMTSWSVRPIDAIKASRDPAFVKGTGASKQSALMDTMAKEYGLAKPAIDPLTWKQYAQHAPGRPADDSATFRKPRK
jgi:hypothetical protein